jgi:hypothetical protein
MRLPRQVPRPDGSLQGTIDRSSAPTSAQWPDGHATPNENAPDDDPAGLIGAIFDGHGFADDDPATVILAWLAVLTPSIEPPDAARSLLDRLTRGDDASFSDQQRSVLDLLAFVSRHRRARLVERRKDHPNALRERKK